jgi:hypothetical protein
MISQMLLGGLVPLMLFYNSCTDSIHEGFYSFINIINLLLTLYFTTLLNTMDENRNNLIVLSFAPFISFYKMLLIGYQYLHSYYLYNYNSNIIMSDNEYLVNYTLHGKDYSIIIPKSKHYSHSQLLEATGYYTEEVEQSKPVEPVEQQSKPVEQVEDQSEPVEEVEDQSEPVEDQSEPVEEDEDQSEQVEEDEDQSEQVEDQSEPVEDQSEPVEEDEDQSEQVEDQSEPVEEQIEQEVEQSDPEEEQYEPKIVQIQREIDILDSLHKFLGPYNNFHNSMVCITPDILGFDSIKVRYINEDFDEVVKEFSKDDVLHF